MTMSTLIMSGVPLVEALEIVGNVIENRVIRKAVKDCRRGYAGNPDVRTIRGF